MVDQCEDMRCGIATPPSERMTASVRTAAAAAAAEPRRVHVLPASHARPPARHPNPRSNADVLLSDRRELGGTGKPEHVVHATKSTTTTVRTADSTATAAVFIYPPSERVPLLPADLARRGGARAATRRALRRGLLRHGAALGRPVGNSAELRAAGPRPVRGLVRRGGGAAPGVHGAARMDVARALRPASPISSWRCRPTCRRRRPRSTRPTQRRRRARRRRGRGRRLGVGGRAARAHRARASRARAARSALGARRRLPPPF